jgi:hypothetical protein
MLYSLNDDSLIIRRYSETYKLANGDIVRIYEVIQNPPSYFFGISLGLGVSAAVRLAFGDLDPLSEIGGDFFLLITGIWMGTKYYSRLFAGETKMLLDVMGSNGKIDVEQLRKYSCGHVSPSDSSAIRR